MMVWLWSLLSCQPAQPLSPGAEAETAMGDLALLQDLESHPERAGRICAQLQGTDARARCEAISMRPHLWAAPPARRQARRVAGGPSSRQLVPQATSRLVDVAPSQEPCPAGVTLATCYEQRARSRGDAVAAVADCHNLPPHAEGGWREECLFAAAEQVASYGDAIELCLLSGPFQSNCFQHLTMTRAESIPAATIEQAPPWSAVLAHATEMQAAWDGRDPAFGEAMVDMMWARALDTSYVRAGIVAGNPLDHLPAKAHPHVRAAAVYHLMSMEGADAYPSIEAWVARSARALDARLTTADRRPQQPFQRDHHDRAWSADRPGDGTYPARYYMTDGRRTTDTDVSTDLAICVLEAAARLGGEALLQEGLRHEQQPVQWTAQRLLGR